MESLETIKDGKLYWETGFETYGGHLLKRLQELRPNIPMFGIYSTPMFSGASKGDPIDLYYKIKKGQEGTFAELNPFARILVTVHEHSYIAHKSIVTIHDSSLREDVTQVISELNEKSGKDFKVMYT